ncbi:MAG: tetratricopeptide repeat protein [Rhodocyclales bacterium]|nr:tetratricopeptide repeat protein [Rhodocyclales bacterium]
MSLLMDALKRAELAKQQGQQSDDPASELSLEPTSAPESGPPPATLPELPAKLEDLDDEFMEQASKPAARRKPAGADAAQHAGAASRRTKQAARPAEPSAAETTAERAAIRNAFAAKAGIGNERKVILIAAALGLLAVGAIGTWFWLEFKPVASLVATTAPAGQAMASRQGSIAITAPEAPPATPATGTISAPPPAQPMLQESDDEQETASPAIVRQPPPRRPVAPLLPADAAIRITTARPGVEPGVAEGYRLLQSGNLAAARAAYSETLRGDPRNADALHGIAAIALRQGKTDEAEAAYLRVLEANPADPAAQAAMVGLAGQGDPIAGESRMKSLLAAQGELPVVNFALGNLYARQQRWNDAQQAYFKAVSGEAGNPDYLFNLAVSLDQLHQAKLAAQYYGQALSAAETRPSAFDRVLAAKRMRELQP